MENEELSRIEPQAAPGGRAKEEEERCAAQRAICFQLLERWVPLAISESLAIEKEVRGKAVIDEEAFEAGLKAGAFVLKVLERLARLDGLDAAEKRELSSGAETIDPLELAKRVEVISPLLTVRLQEALMHENLPFSDLPEKRSTRKRKKD